MKFIFLIFVFLFCLTDACRGHSNENHFNPRSRRAVGNAYKDDDFLNQIKNPSFWLNDWNLGAMGRRVKTLRRYGGKNGVITPSPGGERKEIVNN